MFGLGKVFSGLAGGLLDKIGLGFMKPLVSAAVNFFTGDYLSLIGDVTNLVGQFTNSSFLKNLSQLNPLGSFSGGSNCFGNLMSGGRTNLLQSAAKLLGLKKVDKMFDLVNEFRSSFSAIQQNRESAHYNFLR